MAQPVTDDELWQRKLARRRLVGAIALVLLVVVFLPWVLDDKPKPLTKNVDVQIPSIDPAEKKFGTPAAPNGTAASPAASTPPAVEPVPSTVPAPNPATAAPEVGTGPSTTSPAATPSVDNKAVAGPGATTTEPAPATSAPITSTAPVEMKPEPTAPDSRPRAKSEDHDTEKKPTPATKPVAKKPVAATTGKFVVPLGTFSKEDNARRLIQRVRAVNLPVYLERFRSDDGTQWRVRLGPFGSEATAERARKTVVREGIAPGPTKVISLE